jgi:hypothetical protein
MIAIPAANWKRELLELGVAASEHRWVYRDAMKVLAEFAPQKPKTRGVKN